MWLFRGAQSAFFYYAACTPCYEYAYQRQRKREAARSRDSDTQGITQNQPETHELDDLVTEQPRPFKQPPAFSTNAFWSEEIALGPGPPVRKGGEKVRRKNAACRPGSQRSMASPDGRVDPESVREVLRKLKGTPKKEKDRALRVLSEKWERVRLHHQHQREDELLWGVNVCDVRGSSVGFSGPKRVDTDGSIRYESASRKARPDLRYPVIVPNPQSKEETRWMLQPPPVARVMAGKLSPSATPLASLQATPRVRPRPPMADDIDLLEEEEDENWLLTEMLSDGLSNATSVVSSRPQSPMVVTPGSVSHTQSVHKPNEPVDPGLKPPTPALLSPSPFRSRSNTRPPSTTRTKSPPPTLSSIPEPRPESKETIDSGKAFRVVTPSNLHGEKVKSIHLEYQPAAKDDLNAIISTGRGSKVSSHKRTFRWSMDV